MPIASNRIRASAESGARSPPHWAVVCSRAAASSNPSTLNMARSKRDVALNAIVVVWASHRISTTSAPRLAAIAVNSIVRRLLPRPGAPTILTRQPYRDRTRFAANSTPLRGPASGPRCGPTPSGWHPPRGAVVRHGGVDALDGNVFDGPEPGGVFDEARRGERAQNSIGRGGCLHPLRHTDGMADCGVSAWS